MTAEEIRNSQFESDDGAWESAHWLKEIAAQLADLNEQLCSVIRPDDGEFAKLRRKPAIRTEVHS